MPYGINRRMAVAPMLKWTDRHCRYFHRLLSQHALLYTEMVTTGAVLHGDRQHLLAYDSAEHPLALQLGGSDAADLARCARIAADFGYDEVNLNIGCPSDRVRSGQFGVCLMVEPNRVAEGVSAMRAAVDLPITVKTRIGVDDHDSYEELADFVSHVAAGGCEVFIIHARKAWLKGLNPKQNRQIPPLRYDRVYQLKQDFPMLTIVINGGLTNLEQAKAQLHYVDGVMIGRAAYENPWLLAGVDQYFFNSAASFTHPVQVIQAFLPYMEKQLQQGVRLQAMTRHILGLFQGMPGARVWRRILSEQAWQRDAGIDVVEAALKQIMRYGDRQAGYILETCSV